MLRRYFNSPFAIALLALAAIALSQRAATAQDAPYPSHPITMTHGFAAGGNADVIARIVSEGLSTRLGQPVVVEPRPGAGGNTAATRIAKGTTPDGYTLILLTGAHSVSPAMYKSLPYDALNDFQMLSRAGYQAFIVAVREDSKFKTLTDLIAYAKENPGKLTYSSVGVGSTQHLAGELLSAMAGIKMTHIPYRGGGGPMTDLLGGAIDINIDTITVIEPQIRAGKVRGLAVTAGQKWWSLPDMPTVAQTVPGYDVRTYIGFATAAHTPAPIVQKLTSELHTVLTTAAIKEKLGQTGLDVQPSTPEEMQQLVAGEMAKWKKVVADAKIPQF
jgi:tripartite-type tricarboxylate transporter receptor subunit TctC